MTGTFDAPGLATTSSIAVTMTGNGVVRSPTTTVCSKRSALRVSSQGFPGSPSCASGTNFREAFDNFDFDRVANYAEHDVERLLGNAGIIRHRGKIVSTINNARRARELADEAGSLAAWFWRFEPQPHERPARIDHATLMAMPKTETSVRISKELKKRGWTFVGPTTVYAFMQAMGMVNDHLEGCICRAEIEAERARFKRPA